nr:hypothetical protein [Tanacetum cinerariifolium]
MNPVAAKQVDLDNDLVPLEKRIKIEKCNARIEFSKPQREETYQVTLDALKLSHFYPAFLITAEKLGYSGKCDMLSAIYTDQMLQPWRTFAAIINRKFKKVISPSRKFSHVLEEKPAVKPKRAKRPTKKSTTKPTTSVVIKETPSESVPKKKPLAKVDRGKCMDLLSNVALLKAAQVKKTLKKSKLETHKLHASGSGDGVGSQPKVPDDQKDNTTTTDKGSDSSDDERNDDDSDEVTKDDDDDDDDDVDSDAEGDKEASDNEKTDSDEDENPNLNQNDYEEEEYEEEYVRTLDSIEITDDDEEYEELYKDVNIGLQVTEHEEEGK